MDSLTPEARVIYDLLKDGLMDNIDKCVRDHQDSTVQAVRKMFDETTTKLDSLTTKIDSVSDELGFDITQLHIDVDKGVKLDRPATAAIDTQAGRDGVGGSGKGCGTYFPPHSRGTRQKSISRDSSPPDSPRSVHKESPGPRVELPHFDGTNPRLWQTRCEDYFTL